MILDAFSLNSKTALVTGGNRGLGQAIAVALAEAGADVAVTSRSGEADATLTVIDQLGRRGLALAADFVDPSVAPPLIDRVIAEFGRIDILVNNAGTIRRAPAVEYSAEEWNAVLNVNLNAIFYLTQAAGRTFLAQGGGKIINIASLLSYQGGITVPAYAAAKHGVAGLTKACANEWAQHNINVNAIAPGYMVTDNTAALRANPERNDAILARIPAGRWGQAADIQGAAVFLASSASDYVNGEMLAVDGGWLAR